MAASPLPPTTIPVLDNTGQFTLPWRRWLQQYVGTGTLTPSQIDGLLTQIAGAIAAAGSAEAAAAAATEIAKEALALAGTGATSLALSFSDFTLTGGVGITLTPSPLYGGPGVIALSVPVTVANGGTGDTTLASHGVLIGNGTGAVSVSAAMTNGQVLIGQTGADPLPKTIAADATLAASGNLTLATVNGNVGTFGNSTNVAQVTVNAKGLITTVVNVPISATGNVSGSGNSGALTVWTGTNTVANGNLAGDITTSGNTTATLATVNGNVGTFGNGTTVAQVTVNAKGLTTAASNVAITSAPKWTAPRFESFTGDATGGPTSVDGSGNWSTALTLASVNGNVGSFGNGTTVSQFTVNGKGLITAAGNVGIISAPQWTTTRTESFTGDVTGGPTNVNGSANWSTAMSLATTQGAAITWSANQTFSGNISVGNVTSGVWLGTAITVAKGGTGQTTNTNHGVLLGQGASAIVATAAMTDGQLLVGQTSADPLPKTVGGDMTMAATGNISLKTSQGAAITWAASQAFSVGATFGDASFYAQILSSNPTLNVDANDYYVYNRAANEHQWYIGSNLALKAVGTGVVLYATGTQVAAFQNGTAIFNGSLATIDTVVASLPSAITSGRGARAFVHDATTANFATPVVGGGAVPVPVYSDGAQWLIG